MTRRFIIGVDFDGTCVDHRFPDVGPNVPDAAQWLRHLSANGASLILWTVRSGEYLEAARQWFHDECIPLWGVCENPTQYRWAPGPKAYCNTYVDDAAFGAPLIHVEGFKRACFDWGSAGPELMHMLTMFKMDKP